MGATGVWGHSDQEAGLCSVSQGKCNGNQLASTCLWMGGLKPKLPPPRKRRKQPQTTWRLARFGAHVIGKIPWSVRGKDNPLCESDKVIDMSLFGTAWHKPQWVRTTATAVLAQARISTLEVPCLDLVNTEPFPATMMQASNPGNCAIS